MVKKLAFILLFIFSLLSAQYLEFSSPCLDEVVTSSLSHTDHENDASSEDHCHELCSLCHFTVVMNPKVQMDGLLYSHDILFHRPVEKTIPFTLNVYRPPISLA